MNELALTIDCLSLTFADASGHEHRVRTISTRAVAILQELVSQHLRQTGIDLGSRRIDQLRAGPVRVDLALTADEQAARQVALGMYEALALQIGTSCLP